MTIQLKGMKDSHYKRYSSTGVKLSCGNLFSVDLSLLCTDVLSYTGKSQWLMNKKEYNIIDNWLDSL